MLPIQLSLIFRLTLESHSLERVQCYFVRIGKYLKTLLEKPEIPLDAARVNADIKIQAIDWLTTCANEPRRVFV